MDTHFYIYWVFGVFLILRGCSGHVRVREETVITPNREIDYYRFTIPVNVHAGTTICIGN
jgi:hypothetical protein